MQTLSLLLACLLLFSGCENKNKDKEFIIKQIDSITSYCNAALKARKDGDLKAEESKITLILITANILDETWVRVDIDTRRELLEYLLDFEDYSAMIYLSQLLVAEYDGYVREYGEPQPQGFVELMTR